MRPLPHIPRGPRRLLRRSSQHLLACPRVSPKWELDALRALVKPQLKGAILHQSPLQSWPAGGQAKVEDACRIVASRLGYNPQVHFPPEGEFFLFCEFREADLIPARAFARILSGRFPNLWLVLDRLYVQNGQFHRRQRGYRLNLVPATNIHLPRSIRAALRGVL